MSIHRWWIKDFATWPTLVRCCCVRSLLKNITYEFCHYFPAGMNGLWDGKSIVVQLLFSGASLCSFHLIFSSNFSSEFKGCSHTVVLKQLQFGRIFILSEKTDFYVVVNLSIACPCLTYACADIAYSRRDIATEVYELVCFIKII